MNLENPRFDKLAEVYGAHGYYASRPDEIADAVKAALACGGPAVVEIPVQEYFPDGPATPGASSKKGGH